MFAHYSICAAVLVSAIASAVFTDEVLKKHNIAILYICASFFLGFCIIILSRHCKIRRKNGILEVATDGCDSDAEPGDEQETPENATFLPKLKSFTALCKRRPIYGIAVFTCAVFLIICLILCLVFHARDNLRMGSDLWSALMLLVSTTICILAVVLVVAYYDKPEVNTTNFSYKPFDKKIEIPMKVYVPKLVSVLMTGHFNIIACILIQLVLVLFLSTISEWSEEDATEFVPGSKMNHTILIAVTAYFNLVLLLCLICILLAVHKTTKFYLLRIHRNNWQRNLVACEVLLPDIEVNRLEDLRLALSEKMNDPQLTDAEKRIVDYISRPWWKTERAFIVPPEVLRQEDILIQRIQNQLPERAPEVEAPLQQNPAPSPEVRRPMTRSRARRRQRRQQ